MTGLQVIKVGMGEGVVAASPQVIISEGIGSCVTLTLYDFRLRIGGLAHVMLPRFSIGVQRSAFGDRQAEQSVTEGITNEAERYHYADTAIYTLVHKMLNRGADFKNMEAKMAGGAKMFPSNNGDYSIGRLNVESVKAVLEAKRIRLAAWDIGGHHGRSVEFHLCTGRMVIRAIGKEDREI